MHQHTEPFAIINSKYQCYLNPVIQLLFPILRATDHTFPFNSSMEGSLSKCLIDTAHSVSNSKDVDALKFRLAKSDAFYNGQIHQESSECPMMRIEVISKGPMPYSGSNDDSTCVSLCRILFSFFLEKYIVCDICVLRSPSFESSSVLCNTSTYTSSMQELIMQGKQHNLQSWYRCNKKDLACPDIDVTRKT